MDTFFITATGTDIGKTHIAAQLIGDLRAASRDVAAFKPVVSGLDPDQLAESDPGRLLTALSQPVTEENVAHLSPWRFRAALSPDMAAAREGREIPFEGLMEACRAARRAAPDILIVEGVGGLLAPVTKTHTVRDWMTALAVEGPLVPVLVAGSYLGTISHTLTTLEVMNATGLTPAGLILSESQVSPVPMEETRDALIRFGAGVPIALVPRAPQPAPDLAAFLAAFPATGLRRT